jgi:hypothetical protein
LADVRELILQAREGVAQAVNAGLVTLYWQDREAHPETYLEGEVVGVWGEDCRHTAATIGIVSV